LNDNLQLFKKKERKQNSTYKLLQKVKSFQSHVGCTELRFCSPQPNISLHCQTMNTGQNASSLPSFHWYSSCLLTEGWPGCRLVTYQDGLSGHRW